MAAEVRASRKRAEPIEVCRSGTLGKRPADHCKIDTRVNKSANQWVGCIRGKGTTDDPDCRRWKKQTPTRWLTCVVSVIALSIRTPRSLTDSAGWMSASDILTVSRTVMEMTTRAEPDKLGCWRVKSKAIRGHPSFDVFDAWNHPNHQRGGIILSDRTIDL